MKRPVTVKFDAQEVADILLEHSGLRFKAGGEVHCEARWFAYNDADKNRIEITVAKGLEE